MSDQEQEMSDKPIEKSNSSAVNSDIKSLMELVDFVFHNLEVDHLVWDGKSWYSHSTTQWSHRDKNIPVREWDPDYPCYGYFSHVFDPGAEDKDGDLDVDEVPLPYKPKMVNRLEDIKHVFTSDGKGTFSLESKIVLSFPVTIQNDAGTINCDHRGSNHMGIEIDHLFDGYVQIPAGEYTVAEFADLAWRVKGNKFDNQYECVFHLSNSGSVEFQDDEFFVGLTVDHGS